MAYDSFRINISHWSSKYLITYCFYLNSRFNVLDNTVLWFTLQLTVLYLIYETGTKMYFFVILELSLVVVAAQIREGDEKMP